MYQLKLTINSGNKSAHPGGPVDFNYQSSYASNIGVLTGHHHGLRLLLGEIVGMQEAAGANA